MGPDVKIFRRPLQPILGVEVADYHLVGGVIFTVELHQLRIEGFDLFVSAVECWGARDQCSQTWCNTKSLQPQKSNIRTSITLALHSLDR